MAPTDTPYRGTRRTQRFARGLAWLLCLGAFAVGSALGAGLWGSIRSQKQAVPLMNVPGVPADAVARPDADEAPPRAVPEIEGPAAETDASSETMAAVLPTAPPQTFDGRPLRAVRTVRMTTTAYSPDERSCGKWADGITASGYSVWTNAGHLVAADTDLLPFGTLVSIPGYHGGRPVPVLDRGGAIKGHRLDLLRPTHEVALKWGVQSLDVVVWEYAD